MSFREAKQRELISELNASQPEPENDTSPAGEIGNDEAPEREPEEVAAEDSVDDAEQPETEADEDASDDVGETDDDENTEWTAREQELEQRAEQAEEARKSMERDYRRKTHKLAESVRAVDEKVKEVESTAEYYATQAKLQVDQFQSVNWQQLQTDPQQYQQAQQAFMQAQQQYRQRMGELKQIQERSKAMQSEMSNSIAEHSRGVLAHQIPDWGGEVYQKLREFAEREYDYTGEQFDEIVDWRPMKMLYDAYKADGIKQGAAKTVKKVGRKQGRKAPGRTADGQPRNAAGQFQKARETAFSNPGDRSAFREFQNQRLQREKGRGRR